MHAGTGQWALATTSESVLVCRPLPPAPAVYCLGDGHFPQLCSSCISRQQCYIVPRFFIHSKLSYHQGMDPDLKNVGFEPGKQHAQYSSYNRRTRNSRRCPFSPAKIAILIVSLIIATSVVVKTWHHPNSRSLPEGVERWQGWKSEPVGTVMWTPCRGDDDLLHAECGYAVYVLFVFFE